jgi:hypothetical protein
MTRNTTFFQVPRLLFHDENTPVQYANTSRDSIRLQAARCARDRCRTDATCPIVGSGNGVNTTERTTMSRRATLRTCSADARCSASLRAWTHHLCPVVTEQVPLDISAPRAACPPIGFVTDDPAGAGAFPPRRQPRSRWRATCDGRVQHVDRQRVAIIDGAPDGSSFSRNRPDYSA